MRASSPTTRSPLTGYGSSRRPGPDRPWREGPAPTGRGVVERGSPERCPPSGSALRRVGHRPDAPAATGTGVRTQVDVPTEGPRRLPGPARGHHTSHDPLVAACRQDLRGPREGELVGRRAERVLPELWRLSRQLLVLRPLRPEGGLDRIEVAAHAEPAPVLQSGSGIGDNPVLDRGAHGC